MSQGVRFGEHTLNHELNIAERGWFGEHFCLMSQIFFYEGGQKDYNINIWLILILRTGATYIKNIFLVNTYFIVICHFISETPVSMSNTQT